MDILTTFYIEAYKKKMYSDIAIGDDGQGTNFYLTDKQTKALELLHDGSTLFLGYGGSARCFVPDTYVATTNGYKEIQNVNIGDFVYSYDIDNRRFCYNKIINKFEYNVSKDLVKFRDDLICTPDHRFLKGMRWTEAESLKCSESFYSWTFGGKSFREINNNEIDAAESFAYDGKVYDLEVEHSHSYCVTKDNIIVHNSGKTVLECFWIIFQCLSYDGVAYALARKELSVLRKTVLITLFNLLNYYRLKDGVDYKYHEQKNKLVFSNGSEIFFIDMAYQPSDPLYTRFGGLELTSAAVDESNESDIDAIGTLFTRCGWRKNVEYGIKKKMLETFNPDKSHVYTRFYAPFRDMLESVSRKFIPALPSDNPHPAVKEWIEDVIAEGDKNRIQRLVYGNFDYDDNPDSLVQYDAICDMFGNDHVRNAGLKYISADLAMSGRDRFVAGYWHGNVCEVKLDKVKSTGKSIEYDLKKLMQNHGVYNSNIVSDADGLGNYLDSYIRNIRTFRGNKRAVNAKDFDNLKSECAWKLAEMINKREIKVICSPQQEEKIKQELSVCLRRDNLSEDTQKKKLIKKPKMIQELGGSPDYFDMLNMKMVFHIKRFSGKKFRVKAS